MYSLGTQINAMQIQLNNAIWHGSWDCNTPGWGWKECDLAAGQDA